MKRNFFLSLIMSFVFILSTSIFNNAHSQTAGTLTFTYTQAAASASATKNVMAVWIENSAGTFIKTKMRYWGNSTNDHLPSWVSKSAQNLTDATSGATRTVSTIPSAFGSKTISWDGTNVSGAIVPDGNYNIFVESSYCNPEPANNQHWIITSFSFTKGTTAVHLTPTGPVNFSGITLDWVPTQTSVENIKGKSESNVFPNPTNGVINVVSKKAVNIKIENMLGEVVFEEKANKSGETYKIIDLSKFANATYFVKVQVLNTNEIEEFKVVLNK